MRSILFLCCLGLPTIILAIEKIGLVVDLGDNATFVQSNVTYSPESLLSVLSGDFCSPGHILEELTQSIKVPDTAWRMNTLFADALVTELTKSENIHIEIIEMAMPEINHVVIHQLQQYIRHRGIKTLLVATPGTVAALNQPCHKLDMDKLTPQPNYGYIFRSFNNEYTYNYARLISYFSAKISIIREDYQGIDQHEAACFRPISINTQLTAQDKNTLLQFVFKNGMSTRNKAIWRLFMQNLSITDANKIMALYQQHITSDSEIQGRQYGSIDHRKADIEGLNHLIEKIYHRLGESAYLDQDATGLFEKNSRLAALCTAKTLIQEVSSYDYFIESEDF